MFSGRKVEKVNQETFTSFAKIFKFTLINTCISNEFVTIILIILIDPLMPLCWPVENGNLFKFIPISDEKMI